VLRQAIDRLRPGLRDIDFALVERALKWLHAPPPGRWLELAAGLQLWAEEDRLYVTEKHHLPHEWPQVEAEMLLPVPGEVKLEHGWVLRAERRSRAGTFAALPEKGSIRLELTAELSPRIAELPLTVRAARPGERLAPLGMGGHSLKLSDFFINHKLPQRARAGWPLIISGSQVAWVVGLRLGEAFKVSETDGEVIHLELSRPLAN